MVMVKTESYKLYLKKNYILEINENETEVTGLSQVKENMSM